MHKLLPLALSVMLTACAVGPDYLAPETLRQQGCTRAADFWAVGVLLFEMTVDPETAFVPDVD